MRGKGFGQPGKGEKKSKGKLKNYSFFFHSCSGICVLEVEALSDREAIRKFNFFENALELCLTGQADEKLKAFIQRCSKPPASQDMSRGGVR